MFGYDYVTLSPREVETRRKLLDQAGWQAYLAPIILISATFAYRQVLSSQNPLSSCSDKLSRPTLLARRISWLLNNTYIPEFGPFHVQLLGLLYMSYLLFRTTYETGNDYMHVTKAFGHVAVSQLPMHYLLAIKSPSSPITKMTGLTHERLNAYHRLFGRIIHSFLATHAILYLRFFAKMNLLPKRLQDWDVRLGIMAFWTLNFLAILAIPQIRAKAYHKIFYRSHVIFSALLLIVLWFHVPYTRLYVGQAAAAWALNGVLRKGASQPAKVRCEMLGSELIEVKARVGGKHLHPYVPGVHIYLNKSGLGPRTPFTVVGAKALEKGETEVELIAKNSHGPMTGYLVEAAHNGKEISLDLEGPYGEAQIYMPNLLKQIKEKHSSFLLVAGGVGATYALPIYKALLDAGAKSSNVRMIWVVRKEEDIKWATPFMVRNKDTSPIIVHMTQPNAVNPKASSEVQTQIPSRPEFDGHVDDLFNERLSPRKDGKGFHRHLKDASELSHDPVTVMVCGPCGLSRAVRKAVGKHVHGYGRDVTWYDEQFGFGGS